MCGLLPLSVLFISQVDLMAYRLVSLAAYIPAVFLLTGWNDSQSRRGLCSLLNRTGRENRIRITEISLPILFGTFLSYGTALLISTAPPWQFWLVTPLASAAFVLIFIRTESFMKYPGRFLMALLWIVGAGSREKLQGLKALLVFTEYPAEVLSSAPGTGPHPDTYVLASLVLVIISATLFLLHGPRNGYQLPEPPVQI